MSKNLSAQQVVEVKELKSVVSVGKRMSLFEDTTSLKTIQEMVHSPLFVPASVEIPTYTFTYAAIWSKFAFRNLTGKDNFLQISSAGVDSIEVYMFDSLYQLVSQKKLVAANPISSWEIHSPTYIFDLTNQPHLRIIYVRTKCDENLTLDLKVGTLRSFYEENIWSVWFNALYFGVIFIMVIYNGFILFTTRDLAYLYYVFFALTLGFTFATSLGYTTFLLGDFHWFLKKYPALPASLATIFGGLFPLLLLQVRKYAPRWVWGIYIVVACGLANAILALLGYTHFSSLMTKLLATFPILVYLVVAVLIYRKGFQPAKIYLFAFLGFEIFVILYILVHENNFLPILRPFSPYFLQLGSAWEIVMLSMALASKINLLKKEKQIAQLENLHLVKEQNALLEEKVKERTNELKSTVDNLHQTNDELTQTLQLTNLQREEIQAQAEQLNNLNNLKDRLLSVIAHDLRSPLASLKSTIEILKPEILDKEDLEGIKEEINKKLNSIDYALNNVLEWARSQISLGGIINKQNFVIQEVAQDIITLFGEIASQKNITILNQLPKETTVNADIEQIRTVLRNLISNAIKFSFDKGVIYIKQESLSQSIDSVQDTLIFSITDAGVGLNKEQTDRLFGINTHFSTRGTKNEKGTGLGLLLCKEFIEKNGGQIWVESELGKGSTFYFSLLSK